MNRILFESTNPFSSRFSHEAIGRPDDVSLEEVLQG